MQGICTEPLTHQAAAATATAVTASLTLVVLSAKHGT